MKQKKYLAPEKRQQIIDEKLMKPYETGIPKNYKLAGYNI